MHNDNAFSNTEQMSIAQTLREVVERLSRLERVPERPQGNRQNMQRANKTCFICNFAITFSDNARDTGPLKLELSHQLKVCNRETGTSHFCRPGGDRK